MSEGFHRPFIAAEPVPGVALVPLRQGARGLELWARVPTEQDRRAPSVDDGQVAVARRALAGGSEEAAVAALAGSLGLREAAGGAVPAGRWETPAFSAVRWSLGVWLLPESTGLDVDGVWFEVADLVERHRVGRAWPGPLLGHVASALAASGDPEAAAVGLRGAVGAPEVLELGAGVAVIPLRTPTLPPATHTNCVVFGGGDALIVDPGSPYGDEQARLVRLLERRMERGDRFARVVLTHHHHDHVAGAEALRAFFDVVVVAHPETARLLAGRAHVDELMLDGDVLRFGPEGRGARVVATPGHAPGHVVLVDDATGIVVAGDMVAGQGTIVIDPPEGDMAVYLRSLALLRSLDARVLVPAHGPPITEPQEWIDALVRHRHWREERLVSVLRERGALAIPALVLVAYDDVSPMAHGLAARQALAHLLKLETEGAARRTADGRWWVSA